MYRMPFLVRFFCVVEHFLGRKLGSASRAQEIFLAPWSRYKTFAFFGHRVGVNWLGITISIYAVICGVLHRCVRSSTMEV